MKRCVFFSSLVSSSVFGEEFIGGNVWLAQSSRRINPVGVGRSIRRPRAMDRDGTAFFRATGRSIFLPVSSFSILVRAVTYYESRDAPLSPACSPFHTWFTPERCCVSFVTRLIFFYRNEDQCSTCLSRLGPYAFKVALGVFTTVYRVLPRFLRR